MEGMGSAAFMDNVTTLLIRAVVINLAGFWHHCHDVSNNDDLNLNVKIILCVKIILSAVLPDQRSLTSVIITVERGDSFSQNTLIAASHCLI